jgi:dihydrofolate reductase
MKRSIIVAMAQNRVIGNQGHLPWHMPNDLKHFKQLTLGCPVIMGRKTFESLPNPLPGRQIIVLTRDPAYRAKNAELARDLPAALLLAEKTQAQMVYIAGGGEVYAQALAWVDIIYMTLVHTALVGDTFFPPLNDGWQVVTRTAYHADKRHAYDYEFIEWGKLST